MKVNSLDISNYDLSGMSSIDEIIELFHMKIAQLFTRCSFATYVRPEQLNLNNLTMTLKDIAIALPANTSFTYYINNTTAPNVETPKTFNGNKQPGVLTVFKPSDTDKAYFSWSNESLSALCRYNKSTGLDVTPWEYIINKDSIPISTDDINGILANIKTTGKYYASGAQMSVISDAPTTSACFIEIHARGADCIQRLTENTTRRRTWERLVSGTSSGGWRYLPQLWNGAELSTMNIGDMTTTATGFYIKISDTQWSKLLPE